MCRIRLVGEFVCGGNNFVFNALMYFEPVQRSENMVKITGPGSRALRRRHFAGGGAPGDFGRRRRRADRFFRRRRRQQNFGDGGVRRRVVA